METRPSAAKHALSGILDIWVLRHCTSPESCLSCVVLRRFMRDTPHSINDCSRHTRRKTAAVRASRLLGVLDCFENHQATCGMVRGDYLTKPPRRVGQRDAESHVPHCAHIAVPKGIFPQEYVWYEGYKLTNQRKANIATLPLLRVHLMNHQRSSSPALNNNTNTLQQAMFIRGHADPV
jgi:hypothetical protein